MVKILNVVGARPNFVKMAPIIAEMIARGGEIRQTLLHTGQHYDDAMSGAFFRDLGIPEPDVFLEARGGTHAEQTARVMLAFEGALLAERPDWVVVVGDVNSTLACALVASKLRVRVAHVEAGLRSYDRTMPEEINRVLTDQISDLLFTPSPDADENLLREGVAPERIVRVGNVMIDTLYKQLDRAEHSSILDTLSLNPRDFAVLTLHRPSNVDDPDSIRRLFAAIGEIARSLTVVFPAHPRTLSRMREFGLEPPPGIKVIDPLGYHDFLKLWTNSKMTLTDSGGLQEETTALGVPCLTLRENTERPITISQGTNQLVGLDPERIVRAAEAILGNGRPAGARAPELWDGRSAQRIVTALLGRSYGIA
ncbi:MAG TPA: UDP-N-acetylglucosamine 2-epimerase (non-hydrolyzing) [Blastocatellia bacterium]|nr:UDP-N-acetylglucosamine 2-epimerase (non-hydrolyzing) [Blastocatellia bacterium]